MKVFFDTNAVIREEFEAQFEAENTSEVVRAIVRSLLAEAVERRAPGN